MLPLVLQIGGVQIEPVTPRLLRVRAGTNEPTVLDVIQRAGGGLDGTGRFHWVEAVRLRQLEAELRAMGNLSDLFRYSFYASAATAIQKRRR